MPRFQDPNLLVGTEQFSDAGVYRLGDHLAIVQTVDFFPPLVDDPFVFGQIAAANSISDVYAVGAAPRTAMNLVGFPDDQLDLQVLHDILRGGAERVQSAGAVVVGGHTVRNSEIVYGLSVTGVVDPERMLTNAGARPGDRLVLTKRLGTGFVTTAYKADKCPDSVYQAACQSMVQLNDAAGQAAAELGAHAVTDISGFGLAGHANELAQASGVTVVLELARLPLLEGAADLARQGYRTRANATNRSFAEPTIHLDGDLDPVRLEFLFDPQTSGGLLISIGPDLCEQLIERLRNGGIPASLVGHVLARQQPSLVVRP